MLMHLMLAAQVATAPQQSVDSTYTSESLRQVVRAAAAANRVAPPTLNAYRAHLESELALIIVDTLGRERTGQVEQLGGTATWSALNGYEAHVQGYRSQSAGFPVSMLEIVRGWSLPMLYGQRLLIGIEGGRAPGDSGGPRRRRADQLLAVHPFAGDRDQYYRYSGGDTVAVLATATRRIPLVRINVSPNLALDAQFAAFDGEIDIDAVRHEIVRMRGRFVVSEARERGYSAMSKLMIRATGTVAVAYVEFINGEYDERYWLPVTQRMEFQATIALIGGKRSVFRIVSRFSDFEIDDTSTVVTGPAAYTRRRATFAPSDTMAAFTDWRSELGAASASVSANDFEDVAPPQWKSEGPPRLTLQPSRFDRVLHFNRVEGLFTGAELSLELRSAAPGVVARAHGGWAWAEKTARGGLSLSRTHNTSTLAVLAERRLASTEEFQREMEGGGSSLGAFLWSFEEVDYVDRWTAGVSHTRIFGSVDNALVTTRIAAGHDADVASAMTHGPIRRSTFFLPNRHAATGSYALGAFNYEFHPSVSGEYLEPGIGATASVEAATGQLSWIRTELSASARRYFGPLTVVTRADAGILFSDAPPPQTLFELGGSTGKLSGYEYKEFAGDRAAVFRSFAIYNLPLFRAPYRRGRLMIPGLTPGIGVGIDGGWTDISSPAAQAAVLAFGDGTEANALSRETGRVRATASVGLTFFSNSMHVGLARPIDQKAPWRWVFGFGQGF